MTYSSALEIEQCQYEMLNKTCRLELTTKRQCNHVIKRVLIPNTVEQRFIKIALLYVYITCK